MHTPCEICMNSAHDPTRLSLQAKPGKRWAAAGLLAEVAFLESVAGGSPRDLVARLEQDTRRLALQADSLPGPEESSAPVRLCVMTAGRAFDWGTLPASRNQEPCAAACLR